MRRFFPRRHWLLIGSLLLLVAAASGYAVARAVGKYDQHIHTSAAAVPEVYTAIVPGARVFSDGRLSHMLEDRVVSAAKLYKEGKIRKILLTGDHGKEKYDEVNAMRKALRRMSVPEKDIFLDHAGFTTYDSLYRARDIFGVKDCVIVTQRFHLSRSVYTARKLGLDCSGFVADRRQYTAASHNWSKFREFFAKIKAWWQCSVTRPKPKFLGEKIPITGDAELTRD